MNSDRFDKIIRDFGPVFSRRRMSRLLTGAALGGALGHSLQPMDVAAGCRGKGSCKRDSDCCSKSCKGGKCVCRRDGSSCDADKVCCSGACREGVCASFEFVTEWGAKAADPSEFSFPTGIAVGGNSVYVADNGNHRVQRFGLNGQFLSRVGRAGQRSRRVQRPLRHRGRSQPQRLRCRRGQQPHPEIHRLRRPPRPVGWPGQRPRRVQRPAGRRGRPVRPRLRRRSPQRPDPKVRRRW